MFHLFKDKSQKSSAALKNDKGDFLFLKIDLNLPDPNGEI